MPIPKLTTEDSFDGIWEAVVYTQARLEATKETQEFVPVFESLEERLSQEEARYKDIRKAAIKAGAKVEVVNQIFDETTSRFEVDLGVEVQRDRKAPLYMQFFPTPPSRVIRLGLSSQTQTCRKWPELLDTAPKSLQPYASSFRTIFAQAEEVLKERDTADTQRLLFRNQGLQAFVDDLNAARLSLASELLAIAATKFKNSTFAQAWVRSFFR